MKSLPLFGAGTKSFSAVVSAQRRLNCFYDIRKDSDRSNIIVRGTPGKTVFTTLSDAPGRGWRVVGSLIYAVAGSTLFSVDGGGNVTVLGTLATTNGQVEMADDAANLLIADGGTGYTYSLLTGTFAAVTDTNYPTGAFSVDVLNSTMYVARPASREFDSSQKLAASTFTPYTFGTKENTSDQLLKVRVLNGVLVLLGSQSTEFWQDQGLSPLPVGRINGASISWGLAARNSLVNAFGTLVFLALNPNGGIQIVKLNGYTPFPISDSDIENKIMRFTQYTDATAFAYTVDGHQMYQITFPGAGVTLMYDNSTGFWSECQSGIGTTGRDIANIGIAFNSKNYVMDANSSVIYQLDSNNYTENGAAIKRQVASRHIRMEGNDFGISEVMLEMETGVGIDNGQGSDPQIMMQISRDGGRTFGPERWKSFGQKGQYQRPVRWDQCGSARDFVFQFTVTDPVKFVVTQAQYVPQPGSEVQQ